MLQKQKIKTGFDVVRVKVLSIPLQHKPVFALKTARVVEVNPLGRHLFEIAAETFMHLHPDFQRFLHVGRDRIGLALGAALGVQLPKKQFDGTGTETLRILVKCRENADFHALFIAGDLLQFADPHPRLSEAHQGEEAHGRRGEQGFHTKQDVRVFGSPRGRLARVGERTRYAEVRSDQSFARMSKRGNVAFPEISPPGFVFLAARERPQLRRPQEPRGVREWADELQEQGSVGRSMADSGFRIRWSVMLDPTGSIPHSERERLTLIEIWALDHGRQGHPLFFFHLYNLLHLRI